MDQTNNSQSPVIPGLPDHIALLCLARLTGKYRSRCKCVSRAFREALSDGDLMHKLREQQRVPSRLVFLCLGTRDATGIDTTFDENGDSEYEWGVKYTGLLWLILDPLTGKFDVLNCLPEFGPEAVCRSVRLAAGALPGQILIHGVVKDLEKFDGCPYKDDSQIWCFDLISKEMFSLNAFLFRSDFAWVRLKDDLYIASGRTYPEEYNLYLTCAERYNVVDGYVKHLSPNAMNDDDTRDEWLGYAEGDLCEISSCMYEERRLCTAFAWGSGLFFLGGISEFKTPVTSGEFYDPEFDTWHCVPNMWPWDDSSSPNVAVVDTDIYAIKPMTNEIIRCHGLTLEVIRSKGPINPWTQFANLPTNNCSGYAEHRILAIGEKLFVFVNNILDKSFTVYTCEPKKTASWKRSFMDLPSGFHILDIAVIEV